MDDIPTGKVKEASGNGKGGTENIPENKNTLINNKNLESKWTNSDGSIKWPPNNGAVLGTERIVNLKPGIEIGRIGNEYGTYVAPPGTTPEKLSLAPNTDLSVYSEYRIIKEIPGVQKATVAPWFDMPGGGIQYKLPMSIQELLDRGFIELIK